MSTQKRAAKEEKGEWPFITYHPDRKRPWLVDSRTKGGGKEGSRKFFETKREAETFAAQCRTERNNQGTSIFGNADLAKYGWTIQRAVEFALEHLRAVEKSKGVLDAMAELIASKEKKGRSTQYCKDLKNRLTRFAAGFPAPRTVATITASDIDGWLDGLPVAPGTRNTFRRDIRTLFSFCKKMRWVTVNEAQDTELATDTDKPPGILAPAEAARLLATCDETLIPYTAISLFAGVRAAELRKLDWGNVDMEQGFIEITAEIAKTSSQRIIPIQDNLRAWLKDYAKKSGPVTPSTNLRKLLDASRRAVGFGKPGSETEEERKARVKLKEWPSNAMRHSFGSYRLAQCQDKPRVAMEMGNTPLMIDQHYKRPVKPAIAAAYWSIMPGEVVAFDQAAA